MHSVQDKTCPEGNDHEQHPDTSKEALKLIIRYRTKKISAFLGSSTLDILELGVGSGVNLVNLPARRRVGEDLTPGYAVYLRKHGVEFVSGLSQLSGQQFDIVILSHVMEHLLDPAKKLVEIGSLLKPGGKLLLTVPLEPPARTVSLKDNNHNLFSCNVQTLSEFLKACGYSAGSFRVRRYGYDNFAAELAVRLKCGWLLYRCLLLLLRIVRPRYEIQAVAGF
jgi:SAM-dependent methyltransferase